MEVYFVTQTVYTQVDQHQHEITDIYELDCVDQAINLFCNLLRPLIKKHDQPYTVVSIDYKGETIANFQSA